LSVVTGGSILFLYENTYLLLLIPVVMFVRMALNAIDGMLAKEHNMKTRLGNILNELGDVVSDACLFLPFACIPGFSVILIVLVVIVSMISEMAGVMGIVIGASRRYDGPMGKSDRAFLFGLLAIFAAFDLLLGLWISLILTVMIFLMIVNIFIRTHRALKEVN
ncbi:CDP-alcohol phosphatidyltransferase family protein, partial [Pseudogracilibacillus sp. SO30301A]|uniref:CDP-alcohol phosphatidyltransferase family protein n=1 Tax=Pseudogracilibacillus sp. SO30301A TaxID=3098291 RepID=UPI00300E15DD